MSLNIEEYIAELTRGAKEASRRLACTGTAQKDAAILAIVAGLVDSRNNLQRENQRDIEAARRAGLGNALIDRLLLSDRQIKTMTDGLRTIVSLKDPVGEVMSGWKMPNGMLIEKVRVPLGVIAIIYESRPDVTAEAAALCLKAGNAVILRGGKEAINSNLSIYKIIKKALSDSGLDPRCVQIVETTDRAAVDLLLKAERYIDVVIPRGGEELIRAVAEKSRIPVIKHYKGVCHVYVDEYADLDKAEKICINAKVQRPATCNAMETMLVHKNIAEKFLPGTAKKMKEAGVELRGCSNTRKILPDIKEATEDDWYAEYLDLILAVRVVSSFDEAVDHIAKYGSSHSDAIVTENVTSANRFTNEVDSAAVYVNASTRLTDGGQFGMGAEIGISTDKLHARGPMGLPELTSYKFVIHGDGQIRE
ncbi:MAG: glutamate-5-semialdehyde dehydrogenase [Planctomycetes bacterium RIFCSPHIGHO2_02_FULL_50_42]|nr:MAG: glutamate-5-semialdehyde dehydrogenase [Planctomycetes bacterium GWA2_50_13]OHB90363.1 MAG: glutamate-5-semialdehyde dehydrogenase [Planctomycetes bacterium RIFCSPHIGHO2_02_FULL_50_42]OHB94628.1 MAG: glutamate-5-semialdehyde dehydrogenase [Planctomycetes bacterium RIFCSPLOWO2_02_FULL_50_16]OHC03630.1 MAG: glutamate-5-semialdehyde dehydrogenase [Planctomycetes bacterium RIFCSPLOWO2_12_FULL_50_35]